MLNSVMEEIDTPLYYNISVLCKSFKTIMMSNLKLRTAVRRLGGNIS